jgi:hypothetical protein
VTAFKKTIATSKARVAKAELEAFTARLEAVDEIMQGAPSFDVVMLCAELLASVAPDCCDPHEDEFKADFLRILGERIASRQEEEAAAAAADGADEHQVH